MLGVLRRRVVSGGSSASVNNPIPHIFSCIVFLNGFEIYFVDYSESFISVVCLRFWGTHCCQSDLLQNRRFFLYYFGFPPFFSIKKFKYILCSSVMLHNVHAYVYYKLDLVLLTSINVEFGSVGLLLMCIMWYVYCIFWFPCTWAQILLQPKGGLDRIRNLSHLIFAGKFFWKMDCFYIRFCFISQSMCRCDWSCCNTCFLVTGSSHCSRTRRLVTALCCFYLFCLTR